MRLAFISVMRGCAWGGSEELWAAAARAARSDGHHVAVSVFDWNEPAVQVEALGVAGAVLIPRPLRTSRWSALFRRPGWLRELDRFAPDVVCLSQGSAYECVQRRSTRPLARWLEGSRIPLVNLIQHNTERVALRPRTRRLARALFAAASTNAFVARRNIERAAEQLGEGIPHAVVVRNPVNLGDTTPLDWPQDSTPAMACVARLDTAIKGQDILLDVLGADTWKRRDWRLTLFGEGPDRTGLEQQAQRLGISDRVRLAGFRQDVRSIWREHHMLVLPSHSEGTPLALVEAMILGRVAVVTDVGGNSDWIRDGENGFLAARTTKEDIDAALTRAWDRKERWQELGREARRTAESLHDPECGRSLLKLILRAGNGSA